MYPHRNVKGIFLGAASGRNAKGGWGVVTLFVRIYICDAYSEVSLTDACIYVTHSTSL